MFTHSYVQVVYQSERKKMTNIFFTTKKIPFVEKKFEILMLLRNGFKIFFIQRNRYRVEFSFSLFQEIVLSFNYVLNVLGRGSGKK
jgi:hypothetical protein